MVSTSYAIAAQRPARAEMRITTAHQIWDILVRDLRAPESDRNAFVALFTSSSPPGAFRIGARGVVFCARSTTLVPQWWIAVDVDAATHALTRVADHVNAQLRSMARDWDNLPLGRVPDVILAHELDVTASAVYRARTRRGIPKCDLRAWRKANPDYTWPPR